MTEAMQTAELKVGLLCAQNAGVMAVLRKCSKHTSVPAGLAQAAPSPSLNPTLKFSGITCRMGNLSHQQEEVPHLTPRLQQDSVSTLSCAPRPQAQGFFSQQQQLRLIQRKQEQPSDEVFISADSGLLNEDTANETDLCEKSLTTRTSALSDPVPSNPAVNKEMLENALDEKLASPQEEEKSINMMVEKAIQTDVVPYSLDVEQFFQSIFSAQDTYPLSPPSSLKELDEFSLGSFTDSAIAVDLTPSDPNSVILLSPMESPCRLVQHGVDENRFRKELDFIDHPDDEAFRYAHASSQIHTKRSYWSSSPFTDVLALAVPVIPTVMWAFSTHTGGTEPIYNIGTLLRGCCLVALCSLRRTPFTTKI
ncbi:syntabulin-like [Lathamus discolor]|uniref:syntabulin-like n=1 Tax=Lathamus discolor TaxID=678569 RepID=UPI0032B6FC60